MPPSGGSTVDPEPDGDTIERIVREFLERSERPAIPWSRGISDSPLDNRDLAIVLTDSLLIHAARDYDLVTLARTLTDVSQLDLPLSPTFREAVAFMLHQQLPDGAMGVQFLAASERDSSRAAAAAEGLALCLGLVERRLAGSARNLDRRSSCSFSA